MAPTNSAETRTDITVDRATAELAAPVDISVLVPVKDEVASLEQLTDEIARTLDARPADDVAGEAWEVIFVDDGSSDGSWEEILRLSTRDSRIRGLRLRRNFGKSSALAAGFAASTGRVIVTLDGDLQDDPAEIPGMIARLAGPVDLVAGHKANRRDPLGKRLPSKVFNRVTGMVTGLKLHDHNCGLKVARREVFARTPLYGEMHRYFAAISHAQGFRVVEQPVNHRPRQHGHSKFGFERYARGGLDLLTILSLTRYTHRPAHLFGGVGVVMGLAGFGILAYLSALWLFTDQAIGDRPLLILGVLLMLLAMQLISLGLLAEMITNREVSREDPLRYVAEVADPPAGSQPDGAGQPSEDAPATDGVHASTLTTPSGAEPDGTAPAVS
ncbi:glycosyltransferase family 2 protein [Phytoactinopolyspora halotolerans]|uniref:Glycosyltransferase family 2 protein n=1 Tax=Phytoactinopolyspora halotolerans TaxID=1981512 RepID=A0A6L9S9M9_9ACTN|nr:glycosyltransferase family 2 protein [Phytoactinopolyspora halotolerans]NEE01228.1 glycosyltransferase family 2 protein [Phytoactinopolyspora halotolerans]